jgi:hypothetical protein
MRSYRIFRGEGGFMEQKTSGPGAFAGIHDGERINCAQCGDDPRGELAALSRLAAAETAARAGELEALAARLGALGDDELRSRVLAAAKPLREAAGALSRLPGGAEAAPFSKNLSTR